VADSLATYWSDLGDTPIVQAVSGITNAFQGSADCPTYQLSMFNRTYTMDQHCQIIQNQASLLGAIMLAIYTLVAVRIFMTA
jgi:hypothetical protein